MTALHILFFAGLAPYRLAFAALAALLVGTAIPLAYAWARVLPEDAPPFKIEPGSFPAVDLEQPDAPVRNRKADLLSLLLLLCVTLTYLTRFPGMPLAALLHWVHSVFPAAAANWIVWGGKIMLVVGTGLAACLATVRPGPMRVPLVTAASLVLTLWLLGPILQSALLSG
ncbi:MAG TPA: hypothetical protein VN780_12690 [Candidatus Eisenbacteria bacterium]|jgi:hypothetical protein|nr:hypothetical protein [Candidatus Eisenbacteria bacterium]